MAKPYQKRAIRNLSSAGMSAAKFTVGTADKATTDDIGMGKPSMAPPPNLSQYRASPSRSHPTLPRKYAQTDPPHEPNDDQAKLLAQGMENLAWRDWRGMRGLGRQFLWLQAT